MRIPYISLIAAGALTLGGCAYGDLGYTSVMAVATATAVMASNSYDRICQPILRRQLGSPYYGWYDDYYYPGTGTYVYKLYRKPHAWSSRQRTYWMSHQSSGTTKSANWTGFSHRSTTSSGTADRQRRQRD